MSYDFDIASPHKNNKPRNMDFLVLTTDLLLSSVQFVKWILSAINEKEEKTYQIYNTAINYQKMATKCAAAKIETTFFVIASKCYIIDKGNLEWHGDPRETS